MFQSLNMNRDLDPKPYEDSDPILGSPETLIKV